MPFQAIVHAAALRPGARVCLSDLAQHDLSPAHHPCDGETIAVRIGTCCPSLEGGTIASTVDDSEMVLKIGNDGWLLRRSKNGGVAIPGMYSEDWLVIGSDQVKEPCPD